MIKYDKDGNPIIEETTQSETPPTDQTVAEPPSITVGGAADPQPAADDTNKEIKVAVTTPPAPTPTPEDQIDQIAARVVERLQAFQNQNQPPAPTPPPAPKPEPYPIANRQFAPAPEPTPAPAPEPKVFDSWINTVTPDYKEQELIIGALASAGLDQENFLASTMGAATDFNSVKVLLEDPNLVAELKAFESRLRAKRFNTPAEIHAAHAALVGKSNVLVAGAKQPAVHTAPKGPEGTRVQGQPPATPPTRSQQDDELVKAIYKQWNLKPPEPTPEKKPNR